MKRRGNLLARWRTLAVLPLCCAANAARADGDLLQPDPGFEHSLSEWGGVGLLQVPSARMGEDGDISAGASFLAPYHRFVASGQVLPWLEGTGRITQITGVPYQPGQAAGGTYGNGQSYRDRGIDMRMRLYKEDAYLPDITLGIRDFIGTGLFQSEYLVATRRYYDLDTTIGIGWGQLASSNQFTNPFTFLSGHFDRRSSNAAGAFRSDFFGGPTAALFGGFEYKTPIPNLTLKLEYNSDNFRQDPFITATMIKVEFPVDAGFVYKPWPWLELSAAEERGDKVMLRIGFSQNFSKIMGAEYRSPDTQIHTKPVEAALPTALPDEPDAGRQKLPAASWTDQEILKNTAARLGFRVDALSGAGTLRQAHAVQLAGFPAGGEREAIGQLARAIARVAPVPDAVDLTLSVPDGSERRYHLDTRAIERAVALSGRADSAVPAEAVVVPVGEAPGHSRQMLNEIIAKQIFKDLDAADLTGESLEIRGDELILRYRQNKYRVQSLAMGLAARAALAHAPSEVKFITLGLVNNGLDILQVRLRRNDLAAALDGQGSTDELWAHAEFTGGSSAGDDAILNDDQYPGIDWNIRPRIKDQLNGPNGFFLYDLYVGLGATAHVAPGFSLTGELGASITSNFDQLTLESNSVLPHVRSDIADFLKDGRYSIQRLQSDYLVEFAQDFYGRFSTGLLEYEYAGVDAEVLYRPYGQRWAVGLDLNEVIKRGFHDQFGFQTYNVATGQLEFYYNVPWQNIDISVKAGRYLARDWGSTLDISREFDSGLRVGVFATKTNVSSGQFGEGSFDKGAYISIPLDVLVPFASRNTLGYLYRPVTRDGGQMIEIAHPLYQETSGTDIEHLFQHWDYINREQ